MPMSGRAGPQRGGTPSARRVSRPAAQSAPSSPPKSSALFPQYSCGDRSQRAGKDAALCDQCARVSGLDEVIDGLRQSGRSRHSRPQHRRFASRDGRCQRRVAIHPNGDLRPYRKRAVDLGHHNDITWATRRGSSIPPIHPRRSPRSGTTRRTGLSPHPCRSSGLAVEVSALLVAQSAACGSSLRWVARDVAGVVMGLRWRSSVLTA